MRSVGTRFLRLPMSFEPDQLAADMARCCDAEWTRHANQRDYTGEWNGIALRSPSGTAGDLLSVPGIDGYRDTPLLAACRYFAGILDGLACEKETARLLRLAPGAVIREHTDPGASYADGFFRLHVPITTNDQTRFVVDGEALPMQPGDCWYADFTLPHSVRNDGATDRVHLIIDGRRNEWSDRLFAAAGYDFAAEARQRQMDPQTRRLVIANLRARGTEVDLRLARQLEDGADAPR
jgi:hypothetical protein